MSALVDFIKRYSIALLACVILVLGLFYVYTSFRVNAVTDNQDDQIADQQTQIAAQQKCIQAFLAQNSGTSQIRSKLVSEDSASTKKIIIDVLTTSIQPTPQTMKALLEKRAKIAAALAEYQAIQTRIENDRKANPLVKFNSEACLGLEPTPTFSPSATP